MKAAEALVHARHSRHAQSVFRAIGPSCLPRDRKPSQLIEQHPVVRAADAWLQPDRALVGVADAARLELFSVLDNAGNNDPVVEGR